MLTSVAIASRGGAAGQEWREGSSLRGGTKGREREGAAFSRGISLFCLVCARLERKQTFSRGILQESGVRWMDWNGWMDDLPLSSSLIFEKMPRSVKGTREREREREVVRSSVKSYDSLNCRLSNRLPLLLAFLGCLHSLSSRKPSACAFPAFVLGRGYVKTEEKKRRDSLPRRRPLAAMRRLLVVCRL